MKDLPTEDDDDFKIEKVLDTETFDTIYDETTDFSSTKAEIAEFYNQQKKGSKCCGCCCDQRRAVIFVNSASIVLGFIALISYARANAEMEAAHDHDPSVVLLATSANQTAAKLTALGVVISMGAIVGAMRFNIYLVGLKVLFTLINYLVTLVNVSLTFREIDEYEHRQILPAGQLVARFVVRAIVAALYIYPHVAFIQEVSTGILSHETLPREDYSCCCPTTRRRH
jgi:hypothetical protein